MSSTFSAQPLRINSGIVAALAVWALLYFNLALLADLLFGALPLARSSALGEAVWFFLFEVPKVLLLLTLVVFVMGVVRSYFSAERTRAILAQRGGAWNNVLAASLGIVTPFCSCSAVPLFIGFLTAGVPLGVTLSFLISAPMVNEIALALLFGLFGWKIALLYLSLGLAVAIGAGLVIGRLGVERWVEGWVQELPRCNPGASSSPESVAWRERVLAGRDAVRDIVGKVWPYVMVGIGAGAWIHGYVPENFMAAFMGRDTWWTVPAAVLIGIPMYSNAAGIIPVVEALLGKGAALGTVLAFMMSVIALSLPEMIILRKVLRPPLIATFIGVVAAGILLVGYVFNAVL
ncbi:MAG: permease [Sterolibacteriaceae bacterium]|nr:permease [Sterolibacteriaceae bacterium]MBK9084488.1 permease [Sterolibacteriaceae bacterium]